MEDDKHEHLQHDKASFMRCVAVRHSVLICIEGQTSYLSALFVLYGAEHLHVVSIPMVVPSPFLCCFLIPTPPCKTIQHLIALALDSHPTTPPANSLS
eukprot:747932-Hanusia_phi.AAC.3